jgi:hypothetical protein
VLFSSCGRVDQRRGRRSVRGDRGWPVPVHDRRTVPRATAGRPAGSGPGRSGGAAPRSRAGVPGARHPWTPHAGPAPSCSRAGSTRASTRPRRSLSDDPSPQDWPGQIE